MISPRRVLLLIGSAKQSRSTSEALGTWLLERLHERKMETETLFIHRSLWTNERREAFLAAIDRADIIVLAFPLYVDTLPYLVIRALELIAQHRQATGAANGQRLLCIVNCGFPEAQHNDTAMAICRRFARQVGFEWCGGLALGAGGAIDGQALETLGGMARHVTRALELTADALAQGQPIPQAAIALMAKPLVPKWVYTLFGNKGWQRQAQRFGTQKKLDARPFERGEHRLEQTANSLRAI